MYKSATKIPLTNLLALPLPFLSSTHPLSTLLALLEGVETRDFSRTLAMKYTLLCSTNSPESRLQGRSRKTVPAKLSTVSKE